MKNIVSKKSKRLLKIPLLNDEYWKKVIDFTKIKKGGIKIDKILSRL